MNLTTLTSAYDPRSASPNYLTPTTSAPAAYSAPFNPHTSTQPQYSPSPNQNYLTPTISAPTQHARNHYQPGTPHSGSSTSLHRQAPPIIDTTRSTPQLQPSTTPQPSGSPNLDISTLSITDANNAMLALHWLTCDGCGANPLKGNRWRCFSCTDYDLCKECHNANLHSHHQFEMIPVQCEAHD